MKTTEGCSYLLLFCISEFGLAIVNPFSNVYFDHNVGVKKRHPVKPEDIKQVLLLNCLIIHLVNFFLVLFVPNADELEDACAPFLDGRRASPWCAWK